MNFKAVFAVTAGLACAAFGQERPHLATDQPSVVRRQSGTVPSGGERRQPPARVLLQPGQPPFAPGAAAPAWFPIEQANEPLSFNSYWTINRVPGDHPQLNCTPLYNCEVNASPDEPHRPPVVLTWQPSAPTALETAAGGCAVTDHPEKGVYYFHADTGAKLGSTQPPQYVSPGPTQFTISQVFWSVSGITADAFAYGGAAGSPQDAYAVAALYVTDQRCSDGNTEYGFWKDLTQPDQPVYAYYSDKTNCGGGGCRKEDRFDSDSVDQITSPLVVLRDIKNYEGDDRNVFYSAYFIPAWLSDTVPLSPTGYVMRVSGIDGNHPDRFATCTIGDNRVAGPCAIDVPVESWYPVQSMISGPSYVVATTATSYSATRDIAPRFGQAPAGLFVRSLHLGR